MALHFPTRRRRRTYGNVAVDVVPPLLQAVAAMAATVTLTFFGRRYVSDTATAVSLGSALTLTVGAGVWGWAARKDLIDRSHAGHPPPKPNRSQWPGWTSSAALLVVVMVGCAGTVLWQGRRQDPSLASAYDGLDPNNYGCVGSAIAPGKDTHPSLITNEDRQVGHLELRRSQVCSTVWVKVVFDSGKGADLKGGTARIKMIRPGDGVRAPYNLLLRGGDGGFGNMLSDAGSCVLAEVVLSTSGRDTRGPTAKTVCV